MTWVWSPPRVEKRVDSSPCPKLAPELGFGSGGEGAEGRTFRGRGALEAKTIHTLEESRGGPLILNFAGRVPAEGRRAGWKGKGLGNCQESSKVVCQGQVEIASSTMAASVQDPRWTFSLNLGGVIH